jgi:transposase
MQRRYQKKVAALGDDEVMLFEDECKVKHAPTTTRRWWKKGVQPLIPSSGGKRGKCIAGVVNPLEGTVHTTSTKKHTAKTFKRFLVKLIHRYKNKKKIILYLDNAPIHHSRIIKRFVELLKGRLELIFLPPYSPELNPIERFWKYMRKMVTHNTFYKTFEEFDAALRKFLEKFKSKSAEVLSICKIS